MTDVKEEKPTNGDLIQYFASVRVGGKWFNQTNSLVRLICLVSVLYENMAYQNECKITQESIALPWQ